MTRQDTSSMSTFTRGSQVTYVLPSPPYSSPVVTIKLPLGSDWTSGLHWHATHTEYLAIIQGSALVTLHGETRVYTPEDGIIVVPINARHEWRRSGPGGEELIVKEWTDPEDGDKEVFFRNLSSVLLEAGRPGTDLKGRWVMLQLWVIFWELDNWPVLLDCSNLPFGSMIEWLLTYGAFVLASIAGGVVGFKGRYEEYTPVRTLKVDVKNSGAQGKEKAV